MTLVSLVTRVSGCCVTVAKSIFLRSVAKVSQRLELPFELKKRHPIAVFY
jgi:hypothetical protein